MGLTPTQARTSNPAAALDGSEILTLTQGGATKGALVSQFTTYILPKDNMAATIDPTPTDDSGAGYSTRSRWYNASSGEAFLCVDATAGAAVWVLATLTLDDLGSAAIYDVPTTGDAATSEVVKGDDTRLSDARTPVSHSHPWTEVTSKPAEATRWPAFSEVTSKPATYPPSAHTHSLTDITDAGSAATEDAATLLARGNHTGTQTLATISDAGTAAAKNTGTADAELPTVAQVRSTFEIYVPDPERRAVEAATSGAATIERTPNGQSCYMWIVSKGRAEDLAPGGALGTGVHEAFLVGGVEKSHCLLGMYPAALVNSEPVSQPGRIPWVSTAFDDTRAACAALGAGWHQASIWEWAYIALWCMANGYQPTGNTNHGRSHANVWETVARGDNGQPGGTSGDGKHYAGYGPNAWNHNQGANGIADLVGLVWERLNLMKMVEGRVYLADDNDHTLAETAWTDTLFDMPSSRAWSTIDNTGASDKLKRALVVPNGTLDPQGYFYSSLTGERIPLRGGSWGNSGDAGLGALLLYTVRSTAISSVGLRLARAI